MILNPWIKSGTWDFYQKPAGKNVKINPCQTSPVKADYGRVIIIF
jgi:hypothetical protein